MTVLDDIITGATDDSVSTANLLRKVIVVSHRIRAIEVKRWAESELNGYDRDDPGSLPTYRGPLPARARGTYSGPGGSSTTQSLSSHNVPDGFCERFFHVSLYQPISELEEAAGADDDPVIPWPGEAVVQWNRWETEGTVPRIQFMNVFTASTVVTRMSIRGVIDIIRNNALRFALELQQDHPAAGELGGPTITDSGVQQVVHNITNNIFGDGSNVAIGSGNTQSVSISKGDLVALLAAAQSLGLHGEPLRELAAIMTSDEHADIKRSRTRSFADRVRSGGVALVGGVASNAAADGIIDLVSQFLA